MRSLVPEGTRRARDPILRADIGERGFEELDGVVSRCLEEGEKGDSREKGVLPPAPGPQVNEGTVLAHLPGGHAFA